MASDSTPAAAPESAPAAASGGAAPSLFGPSAPPWARWLGTIGGVFLGAVLVFALYAKVLDPLAFVELVEHEGLDFLLPATWVAAIGLGLEAVLGFALLFNLRHLRVLIPSTGLVVFFVFLTARTYYQHLAGTHEDTGSCGCFGNILDRTPSEAFWQDLFLLVPGMILAFLGQPADPMPRQKLRWGLALGLSALALGFAFVAPSLPIDDLATRLSPGVEAKGLCAGRGETRVCMDDVIFEIDEEKHVVVITDLDDEDFLGRLEALNDYALSSPGPVLWVITPASQEDVEMFSLTNQPAFSLLHCPPGLLRPLYRTLPRSFLTADGHVTETLQGWPDLAALTAAAEAEEEAAYAEEDEGVDVDPDGESGDGDAGAEDDDPDDRR